MVTLCIDEGNTSAKIGLFAGEKMVKYGTFQEDWGDDLKQFIGVVPVDNVIVTSSKEDYSKLEETLADYKTRIVKSVEDIPLEIDYDTPHTLGKDRVLTAYASSVLYPGENAAIFDIGTCMTSDFLYLGKKFMGGNIAPGLLMRLKAMHEHTAKLPWVEPSNENKMLGKSTEKALQNGAYWGMVFEIEGFMFSLRQNYNPVRVMVTGGSAHHFAQRLGRKIYIDPFLNIKGLHYLSKYYD